MEQIIYDRLCEIDGRDNVLCGEPMKKHVTFRIGGPADYLVIPHSEEEVSALIRSCRELDVPMFLLGNGRNLLVSDGGFRGVVVQLFKNYNDVNVDGTVITARAGALNSVVAKRALDAGLTGYEFAAGIPGTIGGAVVMNAGAYGSEMKNVLTEVTVLDENGERKVIPASELELGYRTSAIIKRGYIVLEAKLQLAEDVPEEIAGRMEELKQQRVSKQPLEYPSAGSTFKRPEGYFAGKLIMDAGLRGFTVGGAQVSEKHCGFVINKGDATAKDVADLMAQVSEKVREQIQNIE